MANEVEAKLEHSAMNGYEDQHGWCCAYCEKERKPFRCDDFADIMIHLHRVNIRRSLLHSECNH